MPLMTERSFPLETSAPALAVGEALRDSYTIYEQLGQGAYGTVYRAKQNSTGQTVAVKVHRVDSNLDPAQQDARSARFERETRLCATLAHPHIVRILDNGSRAGVLYIVFEFVPGETLSDWLARRGFLSTQEAVLLMGQVLDALDSAHSKGVIHRDLKPDNIMVVSAGTRQYVKVLDFGIGSFTDGATEATQTLTQSHEILGTPCYSAPEQLRGEPATPRSDIYAWGLIMLECLTGKRVINGATMAEVFHRQLSVTEIPLPSALATHPLGQLLRKALAKAPAERAHDAGQLWMDLRHIRTGDLVGPVGWSEMPPRSTGRSDAARQLREQRQATALSCSLTVLSTTALAPDIETVDAIQRDQLNLCTDVVARFGGQILGTLANRVMAVFGVPLASDSDPRRAARAALELATHIESRRRILTSQRGLDLELRIGIHTDTIIVNGDGSPSGPALNVASRLEGLAGPGKTLASEVTRDLLKNRLRFHATDLTLATERGKPLRVYSLVSEGIQEALGGSIGAYRGLDLIGRDIELEVLMTHWQAAGSGVGRAVLLRGEAGVGKSRLVQALRNRVLQAGGATIDCQCLPEDSNTALSPILTAMRQLFDLDGPERRSGLSRLSQAIAETDPNSDEYFPVLKAWLGLDDSDAYPATQLSPDRQRQLVLTASARLMCHLAPHGLIVIEDMQWADPTTQQLVQEFASLAADHPVLLLMTARSEPRFESTTPHVIELSGLDNSAVERLIAERAGEVRLQETIIRRIIERADGIPLFVEELTTSLLESARLFSAADTPFLGPIPTSLRDLLISRLDQLARAKETAQLASAIGREFDLELLSAVSTSGNEAIQADLDRLVEARVLCRHLQSTGCRYIFRHALIREAAWESMLLSQRRMVHGAIAKALEHPVGGRSDPARLARHYELAGIADRAIQCRLVAGGQSAQVSAYKEAVEHFSAGLQLLGQIQHESTRTKCEIDLRNALGSVLIATQGLASEGVLETFSRSRELLASSDPSCSQRFMTLRGLWTFYNARADYTLALGFGEELLGLASEHETPEFQLSAHECACQTALLTGRFEAAADCASRCEQWFDPALQKEHVGKYGSDPWLTCLSFQCIANVLLGELQRSHERLQFVLSSAEHLAVPSLHAAMLGQAAWCELLRNSLGLESPDDLSLCAARLNASLQIARDYGFTFGENYAKLLGAMMGSVTGDENSIEGLRAAIDAWRTLGIRAFLSWPLAYLAEGLRIRHRYADALTVAQAALDHCEQTGEHYGLSEAYRAIGAITGDRENPKADVAAATEALHDALSIAGQQQARWLQLRAAYTAAESGTTGGTRGQPLAGVLGWFLERRQGLDTVLVRASRRLLQI